MGASSFAVGEIAETLSFRQPQVSKHLKVLAETGIVRVEPRARRRMGKYAGTRWPMDGTFTRIDELRRLTYHARSWTEGEEATATVRHTNDLALTGDSEATVVTLHVSITEIGPKAKLAAFGMTWGYKAQLDALGKHLAS